MTTTYLFYDLETTGLNPCFDQIIQFAAIRTDCDLNELERHNIRIKLNRDVIVSPEAMLVHELGIDSLLEGEPEITAIQRIHQLVNVPGTICAGYNILGFDDEFLRFSFFRNLLPPYSHQFAHDVTRFDCYPLTVMYYLFQPKALHWQSNNGKVSFKLDALNQANQLAQGRAHDAMSDVEMTVALAKRLKQYQKTWDYAHQFFCRQKEQQRLNQLPLPCQIHQQAHQQAILINGQFGASNDYQLPVINIGYSNHYSNQSLWLRIDDAALLQAKKQHYVDCTTAVRKKSGDEYLLLPALERFITRLSPERLQQIEKNKAWLNDHADIFNQIKHYYQDYQYPVVANVDIDASLYLLPFDNRAEQQCYQQFHKASPDKKMAIIQQFANEARKTQAIRLLGRHYPEQLSQQAKSQFEDYLQQIDDQIVDYKQRSKLNKNQAIKTVTTILNENKITENKFNLLHKYKIYLSR